MSHTKRQWKRMRRVLAVLGLEDLIDTALPGREVGVEPKILMAIQGGECFLCGDWMVKTTSLAPNGRVLTSPLMRTRDHVVPKHRGGPNRRNVLLAHHRCNGVKGDRLPYPCELIYLAGVNARLETL